MEIDQDGGGCNASVVRSMTGSRGCRWIAAGAEEACVRVADPAGYRRRIRGRRFSAANSKRIFKDRKDPGRPPSSHEAGAARQYTLGYSRTAKDSLTYSMVADGATFLGGNRRDLILKSLRDNPLFLCGDTW